MSLIESQLAALREIDQLWPEAEVVIIGATALGFYFDMSWRHTADVDLAVALTLDALPNLASRPGWRQHSKREHEFTSPTGAKLDLIPAGPQLLQVGQLQWRNGDVMSLVGMDLAFMLSRGPARWRTESSALARRLLAFKAGMQMGMGT